jgi:hypothetical protein
MFESPIKVSSVERSKKRRKWGESQTTTHIESVLFWGRVRWVHLWIEIVRG